MKAYIIFLVILFLMIPAPAAAMLTADDADPAPVGVMDDYDAFREEKRRLSMERAMEKGLLPADEEGTVTGHPVSHVNGTHTVTTPAIVSVREEGRKQIAGKADLNLSPYISGSWQLLPLFIVPLGAMAILSALSLRIGLRRQNELNVIRKERKKQLHREIESQFRSYFPRMV